MNEITSQKILEVFISAINPDFLSSSNIYLKENKSGYDSIMVHADKNPYRLVGATEGLLARVKTKGKDTYVSFSSRYQQLLDAESVKYIHKKSDSSFLRISLDHFIFLAKEGRISDLLNTILLSSFNFPSFGCCSKYKECSDAGKCLHDDIFYASAACQYKHHLDSGEIFYGHNRNI